VQATLTYADVKKEILLKLALIICQDIYKVSGKNTNKNEFVTAGGVQLSEIYFKNFSSKLYPNLFLACEILNIDAVTGGFNFQAAWTGAYLAAQGIMAE